MGGW
jgi:Protein of unknown function (DUF4238)